MYVCLGVYMYVCVCMHIYIYILFFTLFILCSLCTSHLWSLNLFKCISTILYEIAAWLLDGTVMLLQGWGSVGVETGVGLYCL